VEEAATLTLVAAPGIQIQLWKLYFTLAANTETGAWRGCAVSIPGDAQTQPAQALFGAGGSTR